MKVIVEQKWPVVYSFESRNAKLVSKFKTSEPG